MLLAQTIRDLEILCITIRILRRGSKRLPIATYDTGAQWWVYTVLACMLRPPNRVDTATG